MKVLYVFLVAFLCINGSLGLKCIIKAGDVPKWVNMSESCVRTLEAQVKTEIGAAITYLAMGAHFSRDTINRPGFSKFFFDAASEEREHAIKVIEYLLMRGRLTDNEAGKLLVFPMKLESQDWSSGLSALQSALSLETNVTNSIRNIITTCESQNPESINDYHLVDYFTGEFLDEQYKGQRDLAGKISTLGKMMSAHGVLGEFLFDKKLLNNEL